MSQKLPSENNFRKAHVISARMSPEMNKHVESYRKMKKLSRADIVRDALRHYFVAKQSGCTPTGAETQ